MSDALQPHGLQHARLPCPSLSHVLWVGDAIQPPYPLCPLILLPSVFPSIKVFFSASAIYIRWPKYWSFSISPSNEYSRLICLGWTGWISLLSKGLSRVFSNTTVQKCQFFGAPPSLWSVSHIGTWPLLALLKPGNLAHGDPVCPWVQACHLVHSGPLPTWLKLLRELGGSPTKSSRTEGWPGEELLLD